MAGDHRGAAGPRRPGSTGRPRRSEREGRNYRSTGLSLTSSQRSRKGSRKRGKAARSPACWKSRPPKSNEKSGAQQIFSQALRSPNHPSADRHALRVSGRLVVLLLVSGGGRFPRRRLLFSGLGFGRALVGACVFLAGTLGAVAGGLAAADGSLPVAALGGSVCFGDAASGVGSALGSAFGPAVGPGSAGCAGGHDGRGNRRARRPCWQWCDERGNCIGQGWMVCTPLQPSSTT